MLLCLYFLWVGAGAWPCCHKGKKYACYEKKNLFIYCRLKIPTMDKKNKTRMLYSTTSLSLRENLSTLQRQLNLCTSKGDRIEKTRFTAWVTWWKSPHIFLPCHCYWRSPSCSSPGLRRRCIRCSPRLWLQGRCHPTAPASLLLHTQTRLK